MYDKYHNESIDEFDNCDYVYSVNDVKSSDLVVMKHNVRIISSKKSQLIDLLEHCIHNKQVDIVLISETWLSDCSPALNIPGYQLYRQERVHKKGGGVAILTSSKLRTASRPNLSFKLEQSECVTLEITLRNGDRCLVSSMYRPPNSDTASFLASYNSLICAMKKENPKGIKNRP